MSYAKSGRTGQDAVWNDEFGGFREHVLHGNIDNNNNNNNNSTTMFMVLSSWPWSLREFTRFIWWMQT